MKRSVWVKDAIECKLLETAADTIGDRSLHQIMLHLIHREDFSDLESVRLSGLYEKLFGPLPSGSRNGPEMPPSPEKLNGLSASV